MMRFVVQERTGIEPSPTGTKAERWEDIAAFEQLVDAEAFVGGMRRPDRKLRVGEIHVAYYP